MKVSNLIDMMTKTWDVVVLDDLFYQEDIDKIMTIEHFVDHNDYNKMGATL